MGAQRGIIDIIGLLKLIPESVLPTDHIGQSIPKKSQDLPAIVVSAGEINESPVGIGGMIIIQKNAEDQWKEKRGARISGSLFVDVWAVDDTDAMGVADAVFHLFDASKNQIRDMGFLRFAEKSIGPVETVTVTGQKAVKLAAVYSIIYEDIKTTDPEGAGMIREVHVDISDGFNEKMDISL